MIQLLMMKLLEDNGRYWLPDWHRFKQSHMAQPSLISRRVASDFVRFAWRVCEVMGTHLTAWLKTTPQMEQNEWCTTVWYWQIENNLRYFIVDSHKRFDSYNQIDSHLLWRGGSQRCCGRFAVNSPQARPGDECAFIPINLKSKINMFWWSTIKLINKAM